MTLAPSWSETGAESSKIGFVHGIHHPRDALLDYFVFQGSDAQRTLLSIGFRDSDAARGLRTITSGMHTGVQIDDIRTQLVPITRPRDRVDADGGLPMYMSVGIPQHLDAQVVQ